MHVPSGSAPSKRDNARHNGFGSLRHPLKQLRGIKALVTGEELVAAVAGQGDRDLLACQFADQKGRNGAAIGERLVVMPDQIGQQVHRLGLDAKRLVIGSQVLRDLLGVGRFVETVMLFKADAEGLNRGIAVAAHQSHDQAAIQSAAEESAQGHIAHQTQLDSFFQFFEGWLDVVGSPGSGIAGRDLRQLPITLFLALARHVRLAAMWPAAA